jgi:hypothetical protein
MLRSVPTASIFFRFPSISNTSLVTQISGFGSVDPTKIRNLAGKYRQGYGSPFDLEEMLGIPGLNTDSICCIRITDVVGTVDPQYGSYDGEGQLINDPYPTPFESSGFDLDGVGVIYANEAFLPTYPMNEYDVRLFPNPIDQEIYIDGLPESGHMRIYSTTGVMVYASQVSSGATHRFVGSLDRGVYIVTVSTASYKIVRRFYKN